MRDVLSTILAAIGALCFLAGAASAQMPSAQAPAASTAPQSLPAGPAIAGPPSLAEALVGPSKEDYLAAQRLYAHGDFAGALTRFENAYEASQDPRLLWNAAVCAKAMGHYARAMTLMRRYLDSGSPLVTPEAAGSAHAFVVAAASRTARLDVVSNESEARVYVDGEPMGLTPLRQAFAVDQGVHEVTVKKDGFAEFSTPITLTDSAEIQVQAPLAPLVHEGRMAVHARPGDAIAVDGRVVAGESGDWALPSGMHSVRVTAPGSRPFQADVLVRDGETRTLDVKLEPNRGGVPRWVWIVGGTVLAAGATTAGYLLFKSTGDSASPAQGTIATVRTP
ncbi:MAG: PEGA domain-containing protein [Myxococcota bacterium]|nr:PEGA domain-containing protein [Myxococcota bacterium]